MHCKKVLEVKKVLTCRAASQSWAPGSEAIVFVCCIKTLCMSRNMKLGRPVMSGPSQISEEGSSFGIQNTCCVFFVSNRFVGLQAWP